MTMRGAARRMRSAIAQTGSRLASSRPAAAGISAISRAMAVEAMRSWSCLAFMLSFLGHFGDCHPQVAIVAPQDLSGIRRREPEAEKDGDLYVAVRLFDEARRVGRRAADDLADNHRGAPLELGIARPHVPHQPTIHAAPLH